MTTMTVSRGDLTGQGRGYSGTQRREEDPLSRQGHRRRSRPCGWKKREGKGLSLDRRKRGDVVEMATLRGDRSGESSAGSPRATESHFLARGETTGRIGRGRMGHGLEGRGREGGDGHKDEAMQDGRGGTGGSRRDGTGDDGERWGCAATGLGALPLRLRRRESTQRPFLSSSAFFSFCGLFLPLALQPEKGVSVPGGTARSVWWSRLPLGALLEAPSDLISRPGDPM